jgi:hypothetical protein
MARRPIPRAAACAFPIQALLAASLGIAALMAALPAWGMTGFSATEPGAAYPDSSDGRMAADPTIHALDARGQEIKLDGHLDDAAWQAAESGRGFRQWDPDRGAPVAEPTVFKVAYDEGAIYFAVACLESDPTKIQGKLSRRDTFTNSDVVAVYLDPYHDHTTGYAFKVNPLGVQQDVYVYNDGDMDNDWDAVWEAETSRDANGWYAEIRIPFSAIRYRSAPEMTWGLNVWRWMQGRGQDTAWKTWGQDQGGFVSRFGNVTGIRGIRAPRQVEFLPYVLQSEMDPSVASAPGGPQDKLDGFQNAGLDEFQSLLLAADRNGGCEFADPVRREAHGKDRRRHLRGRPRRLDGPHRKGPGAQHLPERRAPLPVSRRSVRQGILPGPPPSQLHADRGLQHRGPGYLG